MSEKELLAKEEKEKTDKIVQEKASKMNSEWEAFCQTLELEHWDNAQKAWVQLASEGHQ